MEISELQILTDSLSNTEKFYHGLFGFEIAGQDESSVAFSVGHTKLIFRKSQNLQPYYHFAFNIPSDQFEEAYEWVSSKVELMSVTTDGKVADFKNWNAKSFYFFDNNGNILEFIARFDLNHRSSKPFDTSSVISVSEMGMAADDVPLESEKIVGENGFPFFSKQPRFKDFTVIGDDNGLLIMGTTGRHWYPTDKPAQKFWSKVSIKNEGQIKVLGTG